MQAFNRFRANFRQLEHFYIGTLYAYDQVALTANLACEPDTRNVEEPEPIRRSIAKEYPHDIVVHTREALRPLMKKKLPRLFREAVITRLVSVFEVFLAETLQEIFIARPDLLQFMFYQKQKKGEAAPQFSMAQLLSFTSVSSLTIAVIENEKRALSGKSLQKTAKYFKEYLHIDFGQLQADFGELEEIHHIRNQIVHKLGRHDARHKRLSDNNRGNRVSSKYLVHSLVAVESFAKFIANETANVTGHRRQADLQKINTCMATISLEVLSETGQRALERDYIFSHDDDMIAMKDMLFGSAEDRDMATSLDIRGKVKEVRSYIRHLKKLKRGGHLRLNQVDFRRQINKNAKKFPEDFLEEVDRGLPLNYPKDFYVQVAHSLKIKTSAARHLLNLVEIRRLPQSLLASMEEFTSQYNATGGADIYGAMSAKFGITKQQAFYIVSKANGSQTSRLLLQ